jgi:hypothetical protein
MTDDEPRTEPTDDQPTADEASDTARPLAGTGARKVPVEPVEPDKTDMSAVGDDGQVFGG